MVELAQLERGELRLGGAAAGEDVHLLDRRGGQPLVDVVRDLGDEQLVCGLGQHPGNVQANVAGADDGDRAGLQRPLAADVRVAVEPGDEVRAAEAAGLVDAGDVEVAVLLGARREDHCVVVAAQVVELDVDAVLDVAEQPDLGLAEHLVQGLDDALDARVVRSDAVADQTERRGLALVQVDRHRGVGLHQHVRGVDAGRSGADDGHPQRAAGRPWAGHEILLASTAMASPAERTGVRPLFRTPPVPPAVRG